MEKKSGWYLKMNDLYGPKTLIVDGVVKELPRKIRSNVSCRAVKCLILNKNDNMSYTISPFIDELSFSKEEADKIIRKNLWNNFFGLSKNYIYNEELHWPIMFCSYIKYKLKLSNLNSQTDILLLINDIRNAVFKKTIYTILPQIIAVAANVVINTNTDSTSDNIKMNNIHRYTINDKWSSWLNRG